MTQSGRHARDHSSINALRLALASTVLGILTAAVVVLTSAAPDVALVASPVAPAAAVAPVAPGTVVPADRSPRLRPLAEGRPGDHSRGPRRGRDAGHLVPLRLPGARARVWSARGLGGRFNPSLFGVPGLLDPGRAGGRAPSSGDLQTESHPAPTPRAELDEARQVGAAYPGPSSRPGARQVGLEGRRGPTARCPPPPRRCSAGTRAGTGPGPPPGAPPRRAAGTAELASTQAASAGATGCSRNPGGSG